MIEQSQLFDADEYRRTWAGHRLVLVDHGDLSEWIDVEIAELVLACWRAGIETLSSCQGDAGERAWISFSARRENVLRFAVGVFDAEDASAGEWEWSRPPIGGVSVRFPSWAAAGAAERLLAREDSERARRV